MKTSDKRADIIWAAMELIAKNGFHGTPIAMIAEKARVGTGTIYRYFENKDALIFQIYREQEEKLMAVLQAEDYPGKSIKERFLYIGKAIFRYFLMHPLYFRFLEQYHNSPYGESFRREKILCKSADHDIVMNLFTQGIAQKELKDLPIFVHAALAFGPVVALARDHILGLIVLDDELIMRSIAACWDGIKR